MSDYTMVLKGLHHCINLDGLEPNDTRIRCHGCPYLTEPTRCGGILMRDAAATIEDLQAQLPKRGEWVEENRRPRSSKFVCSECHRTSYDPQPTRDKAWKKRCRYAYCPNCGAKMEVQE